MSALCFEGVWCACSLCFSSINDTVVLMITKQWTKKVDELK